MRNTFVSKWGTSLLSNYSNVLYKYFVYLDIVTLFTYSKGTKMQVYTHNIKTQIGMYCMGTKLNGNVYTGIKLVVVNE